MTTAAGAIDSALVSDRCASSPVSATTTVQPASSGGGRATSPSHPAIAAPNPACIAVSQSMIVASGWSRVSRRVSSAVSPKKNAAAAANGTPGAIAVPGCATTTTPAKPASATAIRRQVSRSPSTSGASSSAQIGEVNSSATTCAIGAAVSA